MAYERLPATKTEPSAMPPDVIPVERRDFSLKKERKDSLVTPTDELTGLPYPIVPNLTNPSGEFNRHHHFHPENDLRLQSIAGKALRNCRLQLVDEKDHNSGTGSYHAYFAGPGIPRRHIDQFKICVYACAGYIPRYGIDMSKNEPAIAELEPRQIEYLREMDNSSTYKNLWYNFDPVYKFFTKFVLSQDWAEIDKDTIRTFLTTEDDKFKQKLARRLVYEASHLAVESLKEDYKEAHQAGLIDQRFKADPGNMVYYKIRTARFNSKVTPHVSKKAMQALAAA